MDYNLASGICLSILLIFCIALFILFEYDIVKKKDVIPNVEYMNSKPQMIDNYVNKKNPDFNTVTEIPYLINPNNSNDGYVYKSIKMSNRKNSDLINKSKNNLKKINNFLKKYKKYKKNYTGYNNFPDLKKSNYSKISSIGKKLIIPYNDLPVPVNG